MVRVISDLGGKIKGHRKAGLPLFQQILESLVGLLCRTESGILPHGPGPAQIHIGMNPPYKWIFTGKPGISNIVPVPNVVRGIQHLDGITPVSQMTTEWPLVHNGFRPPPFLILNFLISV